MFRLAPLLLAALLLVPVPVVGQDRGGRTIDADSYNYLRGAQTGTGLEVDNYRELPYLVEDLPESILSTGLTRERIETRIELRMRSAGLTPTEAGSSPYLYVRIGGIGNGFDTQVDLNRDVNYYLDDPSSDRYLVRQFIDAATWSTGTMETHGGRAAYLLETLDQYLDRFLYQPVDDYSCAGGES
jgi:hypothetical protein